MGLFLGLSSGDLQTREYLRKWSPILMENFPLSEKKEEKKFNFIEKQPNLDAESYNDFK